MKIAAGETAARRIRSGMVVGLGTGSTTVHAIRCLGRRLREGDIKDVRGVPTSFEARLLAREVGVPLASLDEVDRIDVAIDGADEVDPSLTLIKGGGAAHTAEKVVDALAGEFIVVVDEGKLVARLGSVFPVPVEVLPFALAPVTRALERLGGRPELRMGARKAGPVVSDHGNLILDVRFDSIPDPAGLGTSINDIPGVIEHGLFVGLADRVLVGALEDGAPVVRELLPPTG